MPSTGREVRSSSIRKPGSRSDRSPRNLLTIHPRMWTWSASSSRARVPYIAARTPPRSMSPTTTTGRSTARARPMLTKSPSRRLISAGLPAPSAMTTSNRDDKSRNASNAFCANASRPVAHSPASSSPQGRPIRTTCDRRSDPGLRSTGFIAASGVTRHATAWTHCARPISDPSAQTIELLDMFCALNGATETPWRTSQRHNPAVTRLLPASEVVPATSSPLATTSPHL